MNETYRRMFEAIGHKYDIDPEYLNNVARIESNFNPKAKSPMSSASGLFQFIKGTWAMYTERLRKDGFSVDQFDPEASTAAACMYANDNKKYFKEHIGRNPTNVELYMAHNLGPGNAVKLLQVPSNISPGDVLSTKVMVNNPIFFRGAGDVKGVVQRYSKHLGFDHMLNSYRIAKKFEGLHEEHDREALKEYMQIDPKRIEWCAYFVNSVLEEQGIRSTRSGMAKSYLKWGDLIDIKDAKRGDIAIFNRGDNPANGHVGFITAKTRTKLFILGGNQSNMVKVQLFPQSRLVGIRRASA